jgi:hypothetical protein
MDDGPSQAPMEARSSWVSKVKHHRLIKTCARPDLAYLVGIVRSYMEFPTTKHMTTVKTYYRMSNGLWVSAALTRRTNTKVIFA